MKVSTTPEYVAAREALRGQCTDIDSVERCARWYLKRDPECGKPLLRGIDGYREFPVDASFASPAMGILYIIDNSRIWLRHIFIVDE